MFDPKNVEIIKKTEAETIEEAQQIIGRIGEVVDEEPHTFEAMILALGTLYTEFTEALEEIKDAESAKKGFETHIKFPIQEIK